MQFFCPMKPPTATQQMHKVRMVNGKPHFYEPPEVAQARAKLLAAVCGHMRLKTSSTSANIFNPFTSRALLISLCFVIITN